MLWKNNENFYLEKNIQNIYIKNDDIYELEFVLGMSQKYKKRKKNK